MRQTEARNGSFKKPSRPPRVVIVDEELPYPLNSGKRITTLNLVLLLAQHDRITYLCHRNADDEEVSQAKEFFRAHDIEPIVVNRSVPKKSGVRFYVDLLRNLFSRLPYSVQIHKSPALQTAVKELSASGEVDLWHCEWTPYAESVMDTAEGPLVVAAHNMESLIWKRYWENEPNWLKRQYIKHQWRKFERFERRVFATANRVIAVSDADAKLAREQFKASDVVTVDNGVDTTFFCPADVPRNHKQILLLGSLDWRPNLDAVEVMLDRIFPQVIAEQTEAELVIVGRKPPRWLVERIEDTPSVTLHADVPDVRPFLWQCGALAVPLRIGGGSRLKILEALATECPVISTAVGAEGLHVVPGEHLVQVEKPSAMSEALLRHMRNPEENMQRCRLGRQLVTQRYDWSILSKKQASIWMDVLQTSGSADRTAVQDVS